MVSLESEQNTFSRRVSSNRREEGFERLAKLQFKLNEASSQSSQAFKKLNKEIVDNQRRFSQLRKEIDLDAIDSVTGDKIDKSFKEIDKTLKQFRKENRNTIPNSAAILGDRNADFGSVTDDELIEAAQGAKALSSAFSGDPDVLAKIGGLLFGGIPGLIANAGDTLLNILNPTAISQLKGGLSDFSKNRAQIDELSNRLKDVFGLDIRNIDLSSKSDIETEIRKLDIGSQAGALSIVKELKKLLPKQDAVRTTLQKALVEIRQGISAICDADRRSELPPFPRRRPDDNGPGNNSRVPMVDIPPSRLLFSSFNAPDGDAVEDLRQEHEELFDEIERGRSVLADFESDLRSVDELLVGAAGDTTLLGNAFDNMSFSGQQAAIALRESLGSALPELSEELQGAQDALRVFQESSFEAKAAALESLLELAGTQEGLREVAGVLHDELSQALSGNLETWQDWANFAVSAVLRVIEAIQQLKASGTGGIGGGGSGGGLGFLGNLFSLFGSAGGGGGGSSFLNIAATRTSIPGGIGGFASGGHPITGLPALVGERGVELAVPRIPTTIIPNHRLDEVMGGGTTINLTQHVTMMGRLTAAERAENLAMTRGMITQELDQLRAGVARGGPDAKLFGRRR